MLKSTKSIRVEKEKEIKSEYSANVELAATKANEGKKLSFAERLELSLELSPATEKNWTE